MSKTASLVILFVVVFVSLLVFFGNFFTIFVFWKHRTKLKRTSFLLINLAVADVSVGFTAQIVVRTYAIPGQIRGNNSSSDAGNISTALQPTFSLERAYALIRPLRHRTSSTKTYIDSVIFAWIAVLSVGVVTMLASYGFLNKLLLWVALCCVLLLALITICISYLAIRKKLTNPKVPTIDNVHNRQNASEQNTKLSRTLFIVIAVSCLLVARCSCLPYRFLVFQLSAWSLNTPLCNVAFGQLFGESYNLLF